MSDETAQASEGSATTPDPATASSGTTALVVVGLVVLAGVVLVAVNFAFLRHWVAVHTGSVPSNNPAWYDFWSGFGSDLGEATLITAVVAGVWTGVRKSNCHVKGCWRIGHFSLEHTPFHLCHRHHPALVGEAPTHAQILELHRQRTADYEARLPRQEQAPDAR